MKKINFLFSLITATMLLWGIGASAQVSLPAGSTFADLTNAITSLAGTGGTIQLGGNLTVTTADATGGADVETLLSSSMPVTIDCGPYQIISSGTGSSGTSLKLTVGNNITVTGVGAPATVATGVTKNVLINTVSNGRVHVKNGGKVSATGDVAINGYAGRLSMEPGALVEINSADGVAIRSTQNFTVWLYGGTLKATGVNAKALYIAGNPSTHSTIKDVAFIADGAGATAIHVNAGSYILTGSTTVTTTSAAKTDIGLYATGGGKIVMVSGVVSSEGTPYGIDAAAGSAVYDLTKTMTITATPDGSLPVTAGTLVTLTAEYNDGSLVAAPVYYPLGATQADPTSGSSTVANNGTVTVNDDGILTVGCIIPGINYTSSGYATSTSLVTTTSPASSVPSPFPSFEYEVDGGGSGPVFNPNVHNEAELVAGVAYLKTNGGGTLYLAQPFTNSVGLTQPTNTLMLGYASGTAFPFTKVDLSSDASNPIVIDCGAYGIQVNGYGGSGTWDGNSTTAANTYILSIGANVTVKGSAATLMSINNRGNIEVANGGTVLSTGNIAVNNTLGRLITRPGSWVENSAGGIAVQNPQNYTLFLRGGTIKASGTNAVAIKCNTNPGTANEVNNGITIIAEGSGATGIFMGSANLASASASTFTNATIKTSSPDNSDVAIDNTGTGAIINAPTNINITSSRIYTGTNTAWLSRIRNIAADPDAGSYGSAQNISLEATDNDGATASEDVYYGIDVLPATLYNSASVSITTPVVLNTKTTVTEGSNTFTTIRSFAYDVSTGIVAPSLGGEAYIAGNILYLPSAGSVQVYNVGGQLVLNTSGATIDISSLNKGIYIVKAESAAFKVAK